MRVLIIHQNFPGQFRHVAQAWAQRPGWEVVGLGRDTCPGLPGVRHIGYQPHRKVRDDQHPYLRTMEDAVLHGQAVARALQGLRRRGFEPDVILAHPGWGETLYAKEVFPRAKLIHFCEWYYHGHGADLGFDPEFPVTMDDRLRVRTWNALHLLNLEQCDAAVAPTAWQRDRHPTAYRDKIQLAHEGVDSHLLRPDPQARFVVPRGPNAGLALGAGDPVITYVARNLEPYRGLHIFLRALERLQAEHPRCHALIVGGDGVSYGRKPATGANWREALSGSLKLDAARTHFLGKLPYDDYRRVLQVSAAHVYLTYPFVLSWSMLEAMASGCLVIGSSTPPVTEVLRHDENSLCQDFFDVAGIAATTLEALRSPQRFEGLRRRARADVRQRYTHEAGIAAYDRLLPSQRPRRDLERPLIEAA